jgi:hypothetical protein
MTQPKIERTESLSEPPRLLLFVLLVILLVIVLTLIGGLLFFGGDRRLGAVVPFGAAAAVLLPLGTIGAALLFRKQLPRRFWLWLTVFWAVVLLVGSLVGAVVYREVLPPRYQEQMLTYVPFMRALMPPTPAGGTIPTVAVTSAISLDELLGAPAGTATAGAAAPALVEVTLPPETEAATATNSPTPTPEASPTAEATQSAAVPTSEPTAAVEAFPTDAPNAALAISLPQSAFIYGLRHEQQTWNNCGPANITMALSAYGWQEDQAYAAQFLKPTEEDKNVSPGEMVNFVNTQTGVRAITRIGGDMDLLKAFVAANFPVVVETTFTPEGYDWIGHYQTIVGYDNAASSFYVLDSYLGAGPNGAGIPESYLQFDRDWKAFNRVFIVVYEAEREALVQEILGDRADLTLAAEHALEVARAEARLDPQDSFALFNIGTALTKLGRYEEAAAAYDQAISKGLPFRMLWYQFGPFEAYFNTGRYSDVLSLAQNNLTSGADLVEETHYWMGRVYEAQGDGAQAATAYRRALSKNPLYTAARDALSRVS